MTLVVISIVVSVDVDAEGVVWVEVWGLVLLELARGILFNNVVHLVL